MEKKTTKQIDGKEMLEFLIYLLSHQQGVERTCEIVKKEKRKKYEKEETKIKETS